jgi:hypothetical protein
MLTELMIPIIVGFIRHEYCIQGRWPLTLLGGCNKIKIIMKMTVYMKTFFFYDLYLVFRLFQMSQFNSKLHMRAGREILQ